MKLLFIQGGSRWKFDVDGNIYTDSNFSERVWNRYGKLCNTLTVILRRESTIYENNVARSRFNQFDSKKYRYIALADLYRPTKNLLDITKRREVIKIIEEEVKNSDRIIIRSLGNIYTNTALKMARKYNKQYLVEVTGFVFESFWYHSLKGKFTAMYQDFRYRRLMKEVPYAIYVTNQALQERYPCNGKSLGCSDVELDKIDSTILKNRENRINNQQKVITLGTAAFLDVNWKGQKYVIEAIAKLKEKGIDCFRYQMIGVGTGESLIKLAEKLGVLDYVSVIGTLPHDKVFSWLDQIDIYVQPSFQEGLCRSIVEAMSRACPVVCTKVGGNYELASDEYLFKKGDSSQLAEKLSRLMDQEEQLKEANRSFEIAKKFDKNELDRKRDEFYQIFMEDRTK